MSIVRAPRPDRGFTILDNDVLRDIRLSFRARGVLAWLLSMPDNWRTDAARIAKETPREQRDAILTALKELKAAGYMVQTKAQDDRGRWSTTTYVYETPQDVSAGQAECGSTGSGQTEFGQANAISSTQTNNLEEDETSRVDAARRDETGEKTRSDWRGNDRRLWAEIIGGTSITSDGTGPWKAGTWSVDAFYAAFRQGAQDLTAKRWPGRFLQGLYDWEDYLMGFGLEVNYDQRKRA